MTMSVLEKLWAVQKEAEIWWDSSPLVFKNWRRKMIDQAENKEEMTEWIDRLFNPEDKAGDSLFRGVTTNPPLSHAAIMDNPEYWKGWIAEKVGEIGPMAVEDMFWTTYKEIVRRGSEEYRKMYDESGGRFGYISGQVDPRSRHDAAAMLRQGLELSAIAPNIMVKVPGTKEGYEIIRALSAHGVSTNNTLSMIIPQFKLCMDNVVEGLKEAKQNAVDLSSFRSVITHMSGRYGSLGDLKKEAEERGLALTEEDVRWAEIALFKKACRLVDEHPEYRGKMLLCSMRLSPVIDGQNHSWHIEKAAGDNVVYTCPPSYIEELFTKAPHLEFEDSTGDDVPAEVMEKLMTMPYFSRAYSTQGYSVDELNTHPAIAETGDQFIAVTEKMVAFVADSLTACGGLKQ